MFYILVLNEALLKLVACQVYMKFISYMARKLQSEEEIQ